MVFLLAALFSPTRVRVAHYTQNIHIHSIAYVYIKKYCSSTFYVGIGQIQDDVLYIKYRGSSVLPTAEQCKMLQANTLLLLWIKNFLLKLPTIRDGPVKSTETRKG